MNELSLTHAAIRTFCTFRAQARLYGIDVGFVREVSTQVAVTHVAQAPPIVRGLANLRSRTFLVLDLRASLGLSPIDCTSESRLVVLNAGVAENLGLLVDSGGEIVQVPAEQIEMTPRVAGDASNPGAESRPAVVVGVCKLHNELMMIIDPTRLVEATEQAIG